MPTEKKIAPGYEAFKVLAESAQSAKNLPSVLARALATGNLQGLLKNLAEKLNLDDNNTHKALEEFVQQVALLEQSLQNKAPAENVEILNQIDALKEEKEKKEALKNWFASEALSRFLKAQWSKFFPMEASEKIQAILESGIQQATQDVIDIAGQGKYSPERQVIRDLMRIIFQVLDIMLIQAGFEPSQMKEYLQTPNRNLAGHEIGSGR